MSQKRAHSESVSEPVFTTCESLKFKLSHAYKEKSTNAEVKAVFRKSIWLCRGQGGRASTHSAAFALTHSQDIPITLTPLVNGVQFPMELDPGATVSLASEEVWKELKCMSTRAMQDTLENIKRRKTAGVGPTDCGCQV